VSGLVGRRSPEAAEVQEVEVEVEVRRRRGRGSAGREEPA